jgi:hypothetical protein
MHGLDWVIFALIVLFFAAVAHYSFTQYRVNRREGRKGRMVSKKYAVVWLIAVICIGVLVWATAGRSAELPRPIPQEQVQPQEAGLCPKCGFIHPAWQPCYDPVVPEVSPEAAKPRKWLKKHFKALFKTLGDTFL